MGVFGGGGVFVGAGRSVGGIGVFDGTITGGSVVAMAVRVG